MKPPQFYISDDYAGITSENVEFYYGYEATENNEWSFTAKFNDTEIIIPFSKLNADCGQFDCVECLLKGIGWVLTKYELKEIE
jgi:hypothetical protein